MSRPYRGTQRSALSLMDDTVKIFSGRDRTKTNLNLSFKLTAFNVLPNYLISMLEMVLTVFDPFL